MIIRVGARQPVSMCGKVCARCGARTAFAVLQEVPADWPVIVSIGAARPLVWLCPYDTAQVQRALRAEQETPDGVFRR